jgi:PilZ domain-containing protein
MDPDRRKESRVALAAVPTVLRRVGGGSAVVARIGNISTSGIGLEIAANVPRETEEMVEDALGGRRALELASLPGRRRRELAVRWSRRREDGALMLGAAFSRPLDAVDDVIAALRAMAL